MISSFLKCHIVDGTGNTWYPGDVGISHGMIAKIGDLSPATANRTIDVSFAGRRQICINLTCRNMKKVYTHIKSSIT